MRRCTLSRLMHAMRATSVMLPNVVSKRLMKYFLWSIFARLKGMLVSIAKCGVFLRRSLMSALSGGNDIPMTELMRDSTSGWMRSSMTCSSSGFIDNNLSFCWKWRWKMSI